MNQNDQTATLPVRRPLPRIVGARPPTEFVADLGRVYLDAGLPLALAIEAALADCRAFETTGV